MVTMYVLVLAFGLGMKWKTFTAKKAVALLERETMAIQTENDDETANRGILSTLCYV